MNADEATLRLDVLRAYVSGALHCPPETKLELEAG